MKTALTIAGSDSSGGAGIQADIKTMTANGVYAMSAITALTAQNTIGVKSIMEVTPEFLEEQLDCIFTDNTTVPWHDDIPRQLADGTGHYALCQRSSQNCTAVRFG